MKTRRDERQAAALEWVLPPWTRELLGCLSRRQRTAFVLHEAGALDHEEVADRMCLSSRHGAQQLHRAACEALVRAARRGVLLQSHAPTIKPEMQKVLDMPVNALVLGKMGWRALDRAGIVTVGQLVTKSEVDVLNLHRVGRKTLRTIKLALADLGLQLGMTVGS